MTIRWFGLLLCGLLIFGATLSVADAAGTIIGCTPNRTKINVASIEADATGSATFVNIAEGAVSFTVGGTKASCVLVRFSAETISDNTGVVIRPFLDNITAPLRGEVRYSGHDGDSYGAHAYDFVFPSVPPGNHVVRMQFRGETGVGVTVIHYTTIVQYSQ
jgi:hypothetical protein